MFQNDWVEWIETWICRVHTYLGLYLLTFTWLFSFTGLLLNHPEWEFAQFWRDRKHSSFEREIVVPTSETDVEIAREILAQLDLSGQIERIRRPPGDGLLEVRVVRPGRIVDMKADLGARRANVNIIEVNAWGVLNMLHSFAGVRMDDAAETSDWIASKLWSLSVDLLSGGLILLALSGIYLWYRTGRSRFLGFLLILAGCVSCGVFVLGLIQ